MLNSSSRSTPERSQSLPIPSARALTAPWLVAYRWPGNIRRVVVISPTPLLDENLLVELVNGVLPPELPFETALQNFKRQLVRQALRECNSSRSAAAHRLKISCQYLHRLINELDVEG